MFKPLSYIVPEVIEWVSHDVLSASMRITPTHLNRDAKVLRKLDLLEENEFEILEPKPRKGYRRKKGWYRSDAEILWIFRQSVRQRGRTVAIETIYQVLDEFQLTNKEVN